MVRGGGASGAAPAVEMHLHMLAVWTVASAPLYAGLCRVLRWVESGFGEGKLCSPAQTSQLSTSHVPPRSSLGAPRLRTAQGQAAHSLQSLIPLHLRWLWLRRCIGAWP